MDFWDLAKLLFRRWYFALPMLALSVIAALAVGLTSAPDYKATGYVSLVPPVSPNADHKVRNPWLDSGINSLAKAAIFSIGGEKLEQEFKSMGLSDTYTIDLQGFEPIVTVEAVGASEEQAKATTREIVRRLESNILTLQQDYGTTTVDMVTTRRLDSGSNIEVSTSKVKRLVVVIGGVGLLITTSLTIALDAVLRRRDRQSLTSPALALAVPSRAQPSPSGALPNGRPFHGATEPARPAPLVETNPPPANGGAPQTSSMAIDFRDAPGDDAPAEETTDPPAKDPYVETDATVVLPLSFGQRRSAGPGKGKRP